MLSKEVISIGGILTEVLCNDDLANTAWSPGLPMAAAKEAEEEETLPPPRDENDRFDVDDYEDDDDGILTLVLLPGNPGVIDFYVDFLEALHQHCDGRFPIYGVSHAGHSSSGDLNNGAVYSLQEQIQHKIHFLDGLRGKRRLVLMGHSLGAYICLQVAKRRPDFRVEQVLSLFPAIHDLYQGLPPPIKLFMRPGFRQLIGWLLHYIPLSIKRRLLAWKPNFSSSIQALVSDKLLRYHVIQNILYLAYRESHEITQLDEGLLSHPDHPFPPTLHFLYGRNDRYTPHPAYHNMKQLMSEDYVHMAEEGIEHAFVLEHSEQVAAKVAELLRHVLSRKSSS
ncbi:hypothetical protein QOT17_004982 [Balamuthia mandrillaris]